MATYFVAQTGSNTAPYDTWAKAATSLQTALTAAASNGDLVVIDAASVPTADKELSGTTTYTFNANVSLFSATPADAQGYSYQAMDPAVSWLGSSTTGRQITLSAGDLSVSVQGLCFKGAGTSATTLNVSSNSTVTLRDCAIDWRNNTSSTTKFSASGYAVLQDCAFGFGSSGQGFTGAGGQIYVVDGFRVLAPSVPPSTLFASSTSSVARADFVGCDIAGFAASGLTLVGNIASNASFTFDRCVFPPGTVLLAPQTTNPNAASPQVYVTNCNVAGGPVGLYSYASAFGQTTTETATQLTGNPSGQSWRVSTTNLASRNFPFYTQTINWYNTTLGAMTPRIEVLRTDSTSGYSDSQLWGVFNALADAVAPPLSTSFSDVAQGADYLDGAGAPQPVGVGTSAWSNPGATAWSGKLEPRSPLNVTSAGPMRVRVAVSVPNVSNLFINPVVLT